MSATHENDLHVSDEALAEGLLDVRAGLLDEVDVLLDLPCPSAWTVANPVGNTADRLAPIVEHGNLSRPSRGECEEGADGFRRENSGRQKTQSVFHCFRLFCK